MGCVSSTLLGHDDEFTQIGGSTTFGHHIVSLTSTTYGLLTLDPPPTPPSNVSANTTPTPPLKPEIINSWELMAGLDSIPTPTPTPDHSFRFSTLPNKENSNPNLANPRAISKSNTNYAAAFISRKSSTVKYSLDGFEKICPPNGGNKVVIYTTTLRGVRKTYEACNAVRSAVEGFGVSICERDISMDRGFKNELRELLKGKESNVLIPPRVFIKGRYIGGVEEVMKIVEEGDLGDLLQGLPKLNKTGHLCDGCGGARFLPCFKCNGSCKLVMVVKQEFDSKLQRGRIVVLRCSDCNENGLVLCPICS